MGNPPESFDPAPSHFHLCGSLNKKEPCARFVIDVDVKLSPPTYWPLTSISSTLEY